MATNDPIDVRVNNMAKWAAGVDKALAEIKQALFVTTCERADSISIELADLKSRRADDAAEWRAQAENKAAWQAELAVINDQIGAIEAPAMLKVATELDENGKNKYSNESARASALIVALQADENYVSMQALRRELERDIGRASAIMAALDRAAKEYGRSVDILTARLNNLTARVAK